AWPLSLFLTPDGRPFYGATYYPPEDRFGRPGFTTVLAAITDAWKTRRDELEASAGQLHAHLDRAAHRLSGGPEAGAQTLDRAAAALAIEFDSREGGFGGAPKFPPAMRLEFLIRHSLRTGEPRAREMVEKTLAKMAAGGMYDQLGGGFHRYSTDAKWLVPHFEKMLYDNALLAGTADIAAEFGIPEPRVEKLLAEGRRKMYEARSRRVAPMTDEKLLTDWTSLAISAFALAGSLLDEPRYGEAARRAADRILASCRTAGDLLHREKDGVAETSGFASDYAFFVEALLDLY